MEVQSGAGGNQRKYIFSYVFQVPHVVYATNYRVLHPPGLKSQVTRSVMPTAFISAIGTTDFVTMEFIPLLYVMEYYQTPTTAKGTPYRVRVYFPFSAIFPFNFFFTISAGYFNAILLIS